MESDQVLLNELATALGAAPFAARVKVQGVWISRNLARMLERMLLQARSAERRAGRGALR